MKARPLNLLCALALTAPTVALPTLPAQAAPTAVTATRPSPTPPPTSPATAPRAAARPAVTFVRRGMSQQAAEKAVAKQLSAGARSRYLGSALSGLVIDAESGRAVWSNNVSRSRMPASTQKVITAYVTLRSMSPDQQFVTRTWSSQANPESVYLRGVGDPTLNSARLASLAQRTAQALRAQGRTSINLYLDDTVFPRPSSAVGWKASYLSGGEVQRIRGLTMAGSRSVDATLVAGKAFRAQLTSAGVQVRDYGRGTAPAERTELAASWSAPVRTILATMLRTSNNDYAEYLLRLSALEAGAYPTWTNSLAHARAKLTAGDIPLAGYVARDGSGLSRANRMPVRTLTATVAALYSHADDRKVAFASNAMPRAGQTGTLRSRYRTAPTKCAAGKVLAKTGTLGDVVGLAGVAQGLDGRDRVFAFLENGSRKTSAVRGAVDTLAAAAVGCR